MNDPEDLISNGLLEVALLFIILWLSGLLAICIAVVLLVLFCAL